MNEVRYSEALSLHLLNEAYFGLFLLPLRPLRPHFCIDDVGQFRPFYLFELDLPLRNLNRRKGTFLEILLPPRILFFAITFWRCSLCCASFFSFSSASICYFVSLLIPPRTLGSTVMVYGANFSRSLWTKDSLFCFLVSKGLFS